LFHFCQDLVYLKEILLIGEYSIFHEIRKQFAPWQPYLISNQYKKSKIKSYKHKSIIQTFPSNSWAEQLQIYRRFLFIHHPVSISKADIYRFSYDLYKKIFLSFLFLSLMSVKVKFAGFSSRNLIWYISTMILKIKVVSKLWFI
jgi:hypothetical protein